MKPGLRYLFVAAAALLLAACAQATATAVPPDVVVLLTAVPTETATPSRTPPPTRTRGAGELPPRPTATPCDGPCPTRTPFPTLLPTRTPTATPTPQPLPRELQPITADNIDRLVLLSRWHGAIDRFVFSPDGTLLVTRDKNEARGQVRRVSDGSTAFEVKGTVWVFSPNGALLATTSCSQGCEDVTLYRVSDGAALMRIHTQQSGIPTFSPEGTVLAVGGALYRAEDGSFIFDTAGDEVQFSPDGSAVMAASGGHYSASGIGDRVVRVYHVEDGGLVLEAKACEADFGAAWIDGAFSPDSTMIAVGGDVYRTSDGTQVPGVSGCSQLFSPDGSLVAMRDPYPSIVRLYHATDGHLVMEADGYAPQFSPDGALLITESVPGRGDVTQVYRVDDGRWVFTAEGALAAFSPDGTLLATWSSYCGTRVYRTSDGSLMRELPDASGFTLFPALLAVSTSTGLELWGIAP